MDKILTSNDSNFNIRSWIKLDNAAIIYPSTLSKRFAAMFRLTVTLDEKIDSKILDKALNNVIKRFPSFRYRLRQGLFWNYFSFINDKPIVQEDVKNPMLRINFKKNNYYMFRVRYYGKRIAVEYFHALTDGTGGLTFVLSLVAEYLRLKHKVKINYSDLVLDPKTTPLVSEVKDSFSKYARKVGSLEYEKPAYHISGTIEDSHILNIITGIVSLSKIKEIAKNYNCTITEFLTSLLILSIQQIKEKSKRKSNKPIKVSVPVNLRKIYNSKTLRNFSSYVNVGIDSRYGHYELDEIIKQVKYSMRLMTAEKKMNSKITGNVKTANNFLIRCIPMFIKKYIISISERMMGDRYCSTLLSNLGLVTVPDEIKDYISKMNFIIGRCRGKPGSCSCIGYQDSLYISFSRKIKESEMERIFFTTLVEMNIKVEIESNEGR